MRGDLKAVVSAILTDPEARGAVKLDPAYGKLREPVLFMTGLARALNAQSDGVYFGQQSGALGQHLFNPASVFNYYPPTYVVPGTAAIGPEFAHPEFEHGDQPLQLRQHARVRHDRAARHASRSDRHEARLAALSAVAGDANALLDKLDAAAARHDARGDARRDPDGAQRRAATTADAREDRVLSRRHIVAIPGGALT